MKLETHMFNLYIHVYIYIYIYITQSTHDGTSHDELLTMVVPARRTYIPEGPN